MLIFLIVVVGLSLLILGHEAGHFFAAKYFKLKVDEFGFGFPPRIFARKKGETEYSVNWLPFGGFVKIAGENDPAPFVESGIENSKEGEKEKTNKESEAGRNGLFYAQLAWKRSMIILSGVGMNFIIGWLLTSLVFMIGVPGALVISNVQSNSPAAEAGVQVGDIVQGYTTAPSFIEFVNQNRGQEIQLEILRGSEKVTIRAEPRSVTSPGEGALGVELAEAGIPRHSPLKALLVGLRQSFVVSWSIVVALYYLVISLITQGMLVEGIVGPVGIFSIAHQAGQIGVVYLLGLLAIISLNLAVVNLLPFPALDGGRFFLIFIEKIKGSPLSRKIEAAINAVGFAFLILLMVLLTIRDIVNL